ncbi:uncharacterized protein LOC123920959 [Trifolium pratense]|uniref:Uncharacterized protein n=1 Tax=Trifolium pratense TaxID=57577 RepID=A0ACB0JNK2_TRIPR|nr:uncharacterized protein LOC123920959 [Trifolium pratense]CAJ2645017.1 unnamed protein product [Trifolium pratense]
MAVFGDGDVSCSFVHLAPWKNNAPSDLHLPPSQPNLVVTSRRRMTEPASNVASCSGTAMEKSSKGYFRNIHTSHQFLLYHFKKIFIFWIQSIMLPRISASNFDVKRCTDNTCNGFFLL